MTRHLIRFRDWEWPKTHTQLSTIWTLKSTDRFWPNADVRPRRSPEIRDEPFLSGSGYDGAVCSVGG